MDNAFSILLSLASAQSLAADAFARQLNAVKVRNAKPGDKPTKLVDGGGLFLFVSPAGSKTWRYRYRFGDKEQTLTIGGFPEVSLECARQAHRAARWLVERSIQPLAHVESELRRIHAEEESKQLHTFKALCSEWQSATVKTISARTFKHREQMLAKHVLPKIGSRPIAEITRKELRELLLVLDKSAPVTAAHCRIYIKQIFEWALDAELVQGNPVPKATSLPNQSSRKVVPRKALPVKELGRFLLAIEEAESSDLLTKTALWLLVLTWCRTAEVIGAKWSEFDLKNGVWTIPAERMKAREPHVVYLSRQAIQRLEALPIIDGSDYLFPNRRRPHDHMNRTTLTEWRKRWGFADLMEIHGLRAVASTWANEAGKFRPDVIEAALAHKEADRVRAAYNRAGFATERREMLQAWGYYCQVACEAALRDRVKASQGVAEKPQRTMLEDYLLSIGQDPVRFYK
jgi:integrase